MRQSGTTTKQMQEAPIGAVFLWGNSAILYATHLARYLDRTDLQIVGPSWLQGAMGLAHDTQIVVDHAAWDQLTTNELVTLDMLLHRSFSP